MGSQCGRGSSSQAESYSGVIRICIEDRYRIHICGQSLILCNLSSSSGAEFPNTRGWDGPEWWALLSEWPMRLCAEARFPTQRSEFLWPWGTTPWGWPAPGFSHHQGTLECKMFAHKAVWIVLVVRVCIERNILVQYMGEIFETAQRNVDTEWAIPSKQQIPVSFSECKISWGLNGYCPPQTVSWYGGEEEFDWENRAL